MLDYEPRRVLLSVVLGCALALQGGLVHAQEEMEQAPASTLQEHSEAEKLGPAKTDKKARELFEKGRAAWDEGRFREAWEYWHHSYRLSRKPELLYNVGQAADRLRMDREALEAFRLYLEKNPNASNRKEVENRIRILEREVDKANRSDEQTTYLSEGLNDDAATATTATEGGEGGEGESVAVDSDGEGGELDPITKKSGQPERKGLYLRGDVGFGLWGDSAADTAGETASVSSVSLVLDAKVGYGVTKEIVVGGGLLIDYALSPEVTGGNAASDLRSLSLTLLSVFGDYYFSPDTDGWRLFGGLGIGRIAISGGAFGNEDAGGLAAYLGGGYELPFDEEIAFGIDARLLVGQFSTDTRDHTLLAPAITGTAVWY